MEYHIEHSTLEENKTPTKTMYLCITSHVKSPLDIRKQFHLYYISSY